MSRINFNPVSFLINLAIGWFFMSFLQAAVRMSLARNWGGVLDRFRSIAFFHDRSGAIMNIAIMAGIWIVATTLWFTIRSR